MHFSKVWPLNVNGGNRSGSAPEACLAFFLTSFAEQTSYDVSTVHWLAGELHFWGILNKSSSKSNVCHYFQIYVHNSTWESPIFVHCTCRNFICCSFVRLQNKVMSLCWAQWGGHFVPCRAVQSLTRLFTWLGEIKFSIHTVKHEVCASKEIACYFFPWSPLPSK